MGGGWVGAWAEGSAFFFLLLSPVCQVRSLPRIELDTMGCPLIGTFFAQRWLLVPFFLRVVPPWQVNLMQVTESYLMVRLTPALSSWIAMRYASADAELERAIGMLRYHTQVKTLHHEPLYWLPTCSRWPGG